MVSSSWGGAGLYPHRLERGVAKLEALGFRVKVGEHARNSSGWVSDTPENRARDIHAFVRDPEVKLILAAVGGDHSCQLLPHLDFELIARHPKLFCGFSDITVLNVAIWQQTELTTLNGPALLVDFAEYPAMLQYTEAAFMRTVTDPAPIGAIAPALEWTDETLDWGQKLDLTRARTLEQSPGWRWLKPGRAEGVLIGGCIESLQHLRGTRYWPEWGGAIFFFETSEEAPSPEKVDGILMDYENMGVFDRITGMLVGRPMRYSDEDKRALEEVVLERTKKYAFPIIAGMDFGHTSPQFPLPIGCRARIDSEAKSFEILEGAVSAGDLTLKERLSRRAPVKLKTRAAKLLEAERRAHRRQRKR